jgi:FkbM family methyltransferase
MKKTWSKFVIWIATASGFTHQRAHHFYPATLNSNSLVIDLGAHKGEFSDFISFEYECSVLGVEANPKLFFALPELPRVRFLNLAINHHDSPITFYLSDNEESSSVFEDIAKSTGEINAVRVPGITLDSLLRNNGIKAVDLLKVDIESAEFQMIEQTTDDSLSLISQITVEFHINPTSDDFSRKRFHAICSRLRRLGFLDFAMDRNLTDVLFLNTNRIHFSFAERMAMTVHRLLITTARNLTGK